VDLPNRDFASVICSGLFGFFVLWWDLRTGGAWAFRWRPLDQSSVHLLRELSGAGPESQKDCE
jgi:hypothetical protein